MTAALLPATWIKACCGYWNITSIYDKLSTIHTVQCVQYHMYYTIYAVQCMQYYVCSTMYTVCCVPYSTMCTIQCMQYNACSTRAFRNTSACSQHAWLHVEKVWRYERLSIECVESWLLGLVFTLHCPAASQKLPIVSFRFVILEFSRGKLLPKPARKTIQPKQLPSNSAGLMCSVYLDL